MSLLGKLLRVSAFQTPVLRTLVPTLALAYGIQAAVAVPSIATRSERFYDASGSLTYLACTGASLMLPVLRARHASGRHVVDSFLAEVLRTRNWRQLVLSAAIGLWALRLGTFLLQRITAEQGRDSRFDSIRASPAKFAGAFAAQATWVSLCTLPVVLVNSLPSGAFATLGSFPPVALTSALGLALYGFGLAFEIAADRQKSAWSRARREKKHEQDFLTSGLWSRSRHPNYFGETTLWTGIAVAAAGVVATDAGMHGLFGLGAVGIRGRLSTVCLCAASPAFVSFLLLKVSGIPLSENKYDQRFGNRKDYQDWKRRTPILFPKLF